MTEKIEYTGKKRYVVGFLFSFSRDCVVLIRKTHPEEQAGLLNGVGGEVGPFEVPSEGMDREFNEEAGVSDLEWQLFYVRKNLGKEIYFFRAFSDAGYYEAGTTNDSFEEIDKSVIDWHPRSRYVSDLKWLIPMALDENVETLAEIAERAVRGGSDEKN